MNARRHGLEDLRILFWEPDELTRSLFEIEIYAEYFV